MPEIELTEEEISAQLEIEKEQKTKAVSETWNRARKAEAKDRDNNLLEKFGTTNLDEILEKINQKPKDTKVTDNSSEITTYKNQISELNSKIENQNTMMNQALIQSKLSSEFSKFNPLKISSTVRDFLDEHKVEIDNGVVSVTDNNNQPIFIDSNVANVDQIISNWSKKTENSYQFKRDVTNNHINQTQVSSNDLSAELLNDPNYVSALKKSGEWSNFMMNKPIDKEKVERIYSGQLKIV